MIRTATTAFAALILASMPHVFANDLARQASVFDGDTLEIHGTRIRLWGIDAPESDQLCRNGGREHYRCGQIAANDLDAFIARRPVKCIEVDCDQYKRAVAVCTVAGIDLADWMVRSGLGLDWPTSRRMKQSAPNVAYGAAVLLSLGGIVLAEDRADYPSAVLIS